MLLCKYTIRRKKLELVSVVIPVYNVEKYITQCVESVLNQTYKNLEIILVDDGSTDKSGEICEEYAHRDSRVTCLHKRNGGLSDARNYGKRYCHGEYLSFIDSDDYVSLYFIESMVKEIEDKDADFATLSSWVNFWDGEDLPQLAQSVSECRSEMVDADNGLQLQLQQEIATGAPFKVVRRSLYEGIDFPFGWYYEDVATTYKLFLRAEKVVIVDGRFYAYRMRKDSIIRQPFNEKKMSCIPIAKQIIADIVAVRPNLHPYAISRAFAMLYSVFLQVPDSNSLEAREIWEVLIDYRNDIIKNCGKLSRRKNVCGACMMILGRKIAHCIGRRFGQKGSMN